MILEETVTGWIVKPWVVVWTSHAGLEVDEFSGNFLRCQSACVRYPTSWLSIEFNRALLNPWFKVLDFVWGFRVLHPLDHLCHCNEVNVFVVGQDLIDPVEEGIEEFRIVLQPGSVEIKTQRSSVCVVMTLKVVIQKSIELIAWNYPWTFTQEIPLKRFSKFTS